MIHQDLSRNLRNNMIRYIHNFACNCPENLINSYSNNWTNNRPLSQKDQSSISKNTEQLQSSISTFSSSLGSGRTQLRKNGSAIYRVLSFRITDNRILNSCQSTYHSHIPFETHKHTSIFFKVQTMKNTSFLSKKKKIKNKRPFKILQLRTRSLTFDAQKNSIKMHKKRLKFEKIKIAGVITW